MTDTETFLMGVCICLVFWCWSLSRFLSVLQRAVLQLQAVAVNQVHINKKTAEVQDILEDVNASLKKIVEESK